MVTRPPTQPGAAGPRREVLLFDLYGTLVDPLAISAQLERVLPHDDAQRLARAWRAKQLEYSFRLTRLARAWRAKQLEYSFRLTVMQRYQDFGWVTEHSLEFALLECALTMSASERTEALARYDALDPFPDVIPGLEVLAAAGTRPSSSRTAARPW
ncbi:hypothetical protein BJF90_35955 [Pseudonocardia sp. CNS-004]|nr:hypothetical protein BJF90_35955 [Pseudonocardia sp. CNS-004]